MLELALVLPLLLVLLVGIIDFGRAYNASASLQAASREGARALALRSSATTVDATVRAAAPGIPWGSGTSISQTACSAANTDARVVLTYDFSFGIPFVPLGTRTLRATGVMRCGL